MLTIVSTSVEETSTLGAKLGQLLAPSDFLALSGELGSGKTQFARGVAAGLGVDPAIHVTSPTYTIMNSYQGRLPLYHFDLYRLAGDQDMADIGFEEYFYGQGVCVVEWAERTSLHLPDELLTISFAYRDEHSRVISFAPRGARHEATLKRLASL